MLYLDKIFICYNQNTITVIKTNSFRGAIWRAKSYLSDHRFMRGTRVYWSRIGPKQFPNVSTTFPVGFQRITLHESMDLVSAPDPYGPGMWLPLSFYYNEMSLFRGDREFLGQWWINRAVRFPKGLFHHCVGATAISAADPLSQRAWGWWWCSFLDVFSRKTQTNASIRRRFYPLPFRGSAVIFSVSAIPKSARTNSVKK